MEISLTLAILYPSYSGYPPTETSLLAFWHHGNLCHIFIQMGLQGVRLYSDLLMTYAKLHITQPYSDEDTMYMYISSEHLWTSLGKYLEILILGPSVYSPYGILSQSNLLACQVLISVLCPCFDVSGDRFWFRQASTRENMDSLRNSRVSSSRNYSEQGWQDISYISLFVSQKRWFISMNCLALCHTVPVPIFEWSNPAHFCSHVLRSS